MSDDNKDPSVRSRRSTRKLTTENLRRILREEHEIMMMERINDAIIELDSANAKLHESAVLLGSPAKSRPFMVSVSMIDEMIDRLRDDIAKMTPDED